MGGLQLAIAMDEKFMPRRGKSLPAHHKIYKHVSVYNNNDDGDDDASYAGADVLYVKEFQNTLSPQNGGIFFII